MSCTSYFLALEWAAIYLGLPLLFYFNLVPIPKIIALVGVAIICIGILWVDSSYHLKMKRPLFPGRWKLLLFKSGAVAVGILLLTSILQPENLFYLPLHHPAFWGIVIILYPLLSVLPQELIYREFFFHRYKPLFGSQTHLMIASACSFSFLHIVYGNIWAILLAFIGGVLFSHTYQKNKSLWWVSVEHTIYGCLVFTIGLGTYFRAGFGPPF